MTPTEKFCKILRERSADHKSAGRILFMNRIYGQVIAILRQELDSLVRAIFLLEKDLLTRQHLINQTLSNTKWTLPNSRTQVTDRHMVDLAENLNGWTNSVYKLGCAFIHLSPLADYRDDNPFQHILAKEQATIKQHLHSYHMFPLSSELNMTTVIPYLLRVLDKVSDNLTYYINDLENGQIGNN